MPRRNSSKRRKAKTILRLPDLEQSKNAVLHSLAATSSQESYGHAIDQFIGWYCSEPRLAFNRPVHGVLEQDGAKNPLAGEAGARNDAHAHLVHDRKHLFLVGPCAFLDSVRS